MSEYELVQSDLVGDSAAHEQSFRRFALAYRLDFWATGSIRRGMDADPSRDALYDRLLAELEAAIDLCARSDRDTKITAIRTSCMNAAKLAAALSEPA